MSFSKITLWITTLFRYTIFFSDNGHSSDAFCWFWISYDVFAPVWLLRCDFYNATDCNVCRVLRSHFWIYVSISFDSEIKSRVWWSQRLLSQPDDLINNWIPSQTRQEPPIFEKCDIIEALSWIIVLEESLDWFNKHLVLSKVLWGFQIMRFLHDP